MHGRSTLLAALAGATLFAALPSSAHGGADLRAPCEGVRVPLAPLVITGQGDTVTETTGPADDTVQCVSDAVPVPPVAGGEPAAPAPAAPRSQRRGCRRSRVEAVKLSDRLASKAVRCLIDRKRTARGLNPLHTNSKLTEAARNHNAYMLGSGCFSHQCSGEPDLTRRVSAAEYLPCTCTWTIAENLAWGKRRYSTPAAIVRAWMHSPPHRETMLMPGLREVGVAMKKGIPGNADARGGTYTADFGAKL